MRQVNFAGAAGQAARDGVAAEAPGDGAGADAAGDPCELAAGVDSRLHPPSAAQTAAAAAHRGTFVGERSVTAGSLRKAARRRVCLGS